MTTQQTFLFYDIETSGLNKSFDQVLQFAAIRTDLELNELERHEILVRLAPDVVPSPYAILTNQIAVSQLQKQGMLEVDAIILIHRLMNQPGTISLGYNTLGFDDEFLRFSFYRNLLPPYTHQFANGCSRADIYPILVCYYLYKNDILNWPQRDNKITFKLEFLNEANQLAKGIAHTAIADVEMTLALAKRCAQEKSMWEYLLNFFNKEMANARISKLNPAFSDKALHKEALLIDGIFGYDNQFLAPVLFLGQHWHYKNKTVWLRLDNIDFSEITEATIAEKTWGLARKAGEESIWLPLTSKYNFYLNEKRQTLIQHNKAWLQANPELFKKIMDYHLNFTFPKIPNLDVDAALYDSPFLSHQETWLCQQFHTALPENKHALLQKFTNDSLLEQAIRILGRNFPHYLPEQHLPRYEEHLKKVNASNHFMLNYKGEPRNNPSTALQEITNLRNTSLTPKQVLLLDDLEKYLHSNFTSRVV